MTAKRWKIIHQATSNENEYSGMVEHFWDSGEMVSARDYDLVESQLTTCRDLRALEIKTSKEQLAMAIGAANRYREAHNILDDIASYPMVLTLPESMRARIKEYFGPACAHEFKPHFTNTPITVGSSCIKCGEAGPDVAPNYHPIDSAAQRE